MFSAEETKPHGLHYETPVHGWKMRDNELKQDMFQLDIAKHFPSWRQLSIRTGCLDKLPLDF